MIKLIASDLDGTLIHGMSGELTPRALKLITRLTDAGVHFAVASGRQYYNERHLFQKFGDKISYIAENGAVCIHNGAVISRSSIDHGLYLRLVDEIRKNPDYRLLVSREDSCFIEKGDPAFEHIAYDVLRYKTQTVDDLRSLEGPILKIAIGNMADDDTQSLKEYRRYLQEKFPDEIKVVTSGYIWIDCMAPDCNKGAALSTLLRKLQIKPEECIAFGDQFNDLEMLQMAGTGYAMAGSPAGVIAGADHVTDSVEDVLEELLNQIQKYSD